MLYLIELFGMNSAPIGKVMIKVMKRPYRDEQLKELDIDPSAVVIDTTSRSKDWTRGFSPFFLGPIPLYNGHKAKNLENAWQYCKVYAQHVDAAGNPNQAYFDWAQQGWSQQRAVRFPAGKDPQTGRGRAPLYALWDGDKLGYIESRQQIYLPLYRDAVRQTSAWKQLWALKQQGRDIVLLDFDGYDHHERGMSYWEVLQNPDKNMGHGFVLAMMLEFGPDVTPEQVRDAHMGAQSPAPESKRFDTNKRSSLDPFI